MEKENLLNEEEKTSINATAGGGGTYEDFNPNDPYNEANNFKPAFCLNFKTGEVWFGGGKAKINADGSGYLANKSITWNAEGKVLSNIVPQSFIYTLTKNDVSGSAANTALEITDVIDKTIVIRSPNSSGNIIPDNAKKFIKLGFGSMYDSNMPEGTIIAKVHIINSSRVLLRIRGQYKSQGPYSTFLFPAIDGPQINIPRMYTEILVKAGGVLEAYAIKSSSAIGDVEIHVLNHGDFVQLYGDGSGTIINGVVMTSPGDIVTKGFGSNSM